MGSFARSLFTLLLGWFRNVVSIVWNALSVPLEESNISWFGHYWIPILVLLCIVGLSMDFLIYFIRWRPYQVWVSFFRKKTGRTKEEADSVRTEPYLENQQPLKSHTQGKEQLPVATETRQSQKETQNNTQIIAELERWMSPVQTEETERNEDPYSNYRKPDLTQVSAAKQGNHQRSYRVRRTERNLFRTEQDNWKSRKNRSIDDGESQREQFTKAIRASRGRTRFSSSAHQNNKSDGMISYQRPAPVIDNREAYLQPVYPPQWKRNASYSEKEEET